MNKEQQIEEIAGTICNACKERFEISKKCKNVIEPCLAAYAHAESLYNAGYRKLPEDSVVLSREEYDSLRLQIQQAHNKGVSVGFDLTKFKENSIAIARKETAEKILLPLYDACKEDSYGQVVVDFTILENLAKQFGVEIQE